MGLLLNQSAAECVNQMHALLAIIELTLRRIYL